MVSPLTLSIDELLADIANDVDDDNTWSHRTHSTGQLLAAIANALDDDNEWSHLRQSTDQLLTAIANGLSDDADVSGLSLSTVQLLAAITNSATGETTWSGARSSVGELLAAIADSNISSGPDDTAPSITSANTNSVAENATLSHSLTANEAVTWSIVGGADLTRFEISGSTLRWASNGTKDFEAPDDANTDNAYVVTVRATDTASNTADQTITVTVTDVADNAAPVNTVAPAITGTETEGETLTVSTGTWTGSAPIVYTYQWYQAITLDGDIVTMEGLFTGISIGGATNSTYVLTADDVDELLYCEVTATNGFGSAMEQSDATGAIVGVALLLDTISATAVRAYSLRKLRGAYSGPAIKVRRSSDDTTQDIGFVSGALDTAALATFVGANSGFIHTWYDQSANAAHLTMATTASQPRIRNTGTTDTKNSLPIVYFDGSNDFLSNATTFTMGEIALLLALNLAAPFANYTGVVTGLLNAEYGLFGESGNSNFYFDGTGPFQTFQRNGISAGPVFSGALQVTQTYGGTDTSWTGIQFGKQMESVTRYLDGWIGEMIAFAADVPGDRTAIYNDQKAYWGTP